VDKLNPDDPRPPYQQVADALRTAISSGEYAVGAKLPGHSAVAAQFGVSVGTVKRAFADLQRDRLIVTRQGQGSYVRATAGATDDGGEVATLRRALEDMAARIAEIERQLADLQGRLPSQ